MPRTRTTGSAPYLYGDNGSRTCATWPTLNAWVYNLSTIGNLSRNGRIVTTIDEVVPNFKRRSAAGEIFNNPFYRIEEIFSCSKGGTVSWAYRNPPHIPPPDTVVNGFWTGHTARYANYASAPAVSPSIDIQTAKTLAGTEAAANVVEPEVQGLVDLAEARKTLRLLKSPLDGLATLARRLRSEWYRYRSNPAKYRWKKGNEPGVEFKDFPSFAAQKWLEVRYGWTPLIMSAQGLAKALAKERKHQRQTARGTSPIPVQTGTGTYTGSNQGTHTQVWQRRIDHRVSAGILYETYFSLEHDLGLSLTEIPSTAWELIPFSFVADWFVNLGSYIRAVTPKAGVRYLSSWTTYQSTETITVVNSKVKPPDETYYVYSGGGVQYSLSYQRRVKDRSPGISVGVSSKLQEIYFEKPKDFKHLADAIALIVSNLTRER